MFIRHDLTDEDFEKMTTDDFFDLLDRSTNVANYMRGGKLSFKTLRQKEKKLDLTLKEFKRKGLL